MWLSLSSLLWSKPTRVLIKMHFRPSVVLRQTSSVSVMESALHKNPGGKIYKLKLEILRLGECALFLLICHLVGRKSFVYPKLQFYNNGNIVHLSCFPESVSTLVGQPLRKQLLRRASNFLVTNGLFFKTK